MDKVIAVVVTYNRLALLAECITALRNQSRPLDAILVINNGSTDGTEAWLRDQPGISYYTQKNIGGAGGFSTAIKMGFEQGYEWIWCMDDDGTPKEDALENLLQAEPNELTLMNCAVIDKNDRKSFVWNTGGFKTLDEVKGNIIEGIGHPFNGTFINRRIIERVGVPKAKFFLWGDETEYYYRIVRINKIPVCTVASSIHYHPATAFSLKKDWDYTTGWKMYFYIRNRFHIQQTKFSNKFLALLHYSCFLVAFAGLTLLFQKTDKMKKLGFIMWPAVDAFNHNFEASPAHILEKLKSDETINLSGSLNKYLKSSWLSIFASFSAPRTERAANA
ncbi:MAG: glycosyltransferase family 2 protein [Chitinophagaceae bacterium]|nr:glycosyltransferase family 2 protein [Chitinophagaceae bacterium]